MNFNKWTNNCIRWPRLSSNESKTTKNIRVCIIKHSKFMKCFKGCFQIFTWNKISSVEVIEFVHYHPGWFPVYRGNFIFVINIKLFRTIKCVTFFLLGIKSEQNFNCNIYFVLMSIFQSWTYVVIVLVEWMLLNFMYLLNNTKLLFSNLQNDI